MHLCRDNGYDDPEIHAAPEARWIWAHVARRGTQPRARPRHGREILVFDLEESGAMAIPFSKLLKLLRVRKPTPLVQKKLIEGIEKPSVHTVKEALGEGADVNKPVRRDVMAPPLVMALRGFYKNGASEVMRSARRPPFWRSFRASPGWRYHPPQALGSWTGRSGQPSGCRVMWSDDEHRPRRWPG